MEMIDLDLTVQEAFQNGALWPLNEISELEAKL